MGANFGGFIFSAQTRTLIDYTDWRDDVLHFRADVLVLIPLIMLTIRDKHGSDSPRRRKHWGCHCRSAPEGMSARAAIRTRAFVLVAVGLLLASVPYQSLLTQIIPHLEGEGMSRDQAAWMLSVLAIFGMVGKVLLGWLRRNSPRERYSSQPALPGAGNPAPDQRRRVPSGPCYSCRSMDCFGGMGSLITLIPLDTFGTKEFATIFGFLSFLMLPSALIGPPIVGYLFDQMQTYTVASTAYRRCLL